MAETAEAMRMAFLALINQLTLVQIPWLFSWVAGYLPLSDSASPEDSSVRPQLEVGRAVVAKAQMWSLEQGSLVQLSYGLMERRT